MRILALDFGGSSVKYGIVNENADIELSGKEPAPLKSVQDFVDTSVGLFNRFRDQVEGISISMPGYINPETGLLVDAGAYQKLYGQNIIELLSGQCDVPICVENDGKCAALAEAWHGSLADCRDGAVLVIGSGIGGGIIKDGKIHSGRDFAAGEFSYIITDPSEHNHLSMAYMSAAMNGLTYRTCKAKNISLDAQDNREVLEWIDDCVNLPYADPDGELIDIKADGLQIFDWLRNGDSDVEGIYRRFIRSLAMVVHSVQICVAPEKIAIGGGLSMERGIIEDLKRELNDYYEKAFLGPSIRANIVRSRYLSECNLVGAAYNYIQRSGKGAIC